MPYDLKPIDLDVETTEYLDAADRGPSASGDRWTLNFGPQHPATHTTLRMVMELDGERVVRVTPHIGYLHSGFEKLGEALDYNQYVTIVSRMDYVSPICNDISWHHAVEKLFDIDITPRCKVVRTILGELGRIQNHLLGVGAAALDLGAFTGLPVRVQRARRHHGHHGLHLGAAVSPRLDPDGRGDVGPAGRRGLQEHGEGGDSGEAAAGDRGPGGACA